MANTVDEENMIFFNWLVFGLISGGSITAQLNALAGGNVPWPYQNISQFLVNIVSLAIAVAGMASFVLLLYGGIRYITSAGDKIGTQHAREVITAAMIGLVIVVGSYAVATTLGRVLGFNPTNITVPSAPRRSNVNPNATCIGQANYCENRAPDKSAGSGCRTIRRCNPASPDADQTTGCLEMCENNGASNCCWDQDPHNPSATCIQGGAVCT